MSSSSSSNPTNPTTNPMTSTPTSSSNPTHHGHTLSNTSTSSGPLIGGGGVGPDGERIRTRDFAKLINRDATAAERRVGMRMGSNMPQTTNERGPMSIDAKLDESQWPVYLRGQPLPYEDSLAKKAADIGRDPLRHLLVFPQNDWELKAARREYRTEDDGVPSSAYSEDAPSHVKACAQAFIQDYNILSRNYINLVPEKSRTELSKHLLDHTYQSDMATKEVKDGSESDTDDELSSSRTRVLSVSSKELLKESEKLVLDMLNYTPLESEKKHKEERNKSRNSILIASWQGSHPSYVPLADADIPLPLETFSDRYLIRVADLMYGVGVFEPMFITLTLFDLSAKTRISESFYCDLNKNSITQDLLEEVTRKVDAFTKATQAIFSVSHGAQDVYIVAKVDKVLEGDMGKAFDTYCKEERVSDKVKMTAKQTCRKLGRYRMPFVWCAVSLMDAARGPEGDFATLELWAQQADKMKDEDYLKALLDLRKDRKGFTKKVRRIPGTMTIHVRTMAQDEALPLTLTPALSPVKSNASRDSGLLTREMSEFHASSLYTPNTAFRHNLFVYPLSLDLRSTDFRNIACRVELLETEGTNTADPQGLTYLFGRSFSTLRTNHIYTSVTYHNKNPDFGDEIKIELPLRLSDRHHLLFSFFHISCKDKDKNDSLPLSKLIGYSWCNLVKFTKFQTGKISLPVCKELMPGYLSMSDDVRHQSKFYDGGKPLFNASLVLDSSVQSDDLNVQAFLQQRSPTEENIASNIRNLRKADSDALFRFLHPILNQLLSVIANSSYESDRDSSVRNIDLGKEAFETLVFIVGMVHGAKQNGIDKKSADLLTYIKFLATNENCGDIPSMNKNVRPYEKLAMRFFHMITTYEARPEPFQKECYAACITHSWFFFELIIKSMAESLHAFHEQGTPRGTRHSSTFLEMIRSLILHLVVAVTEDRVQPLSRAKDLILSVACFVRDLFSLTDRSHVMDIVHKILGVLHQVPKPGFYMTKPALDEFRLLFMRIICSHEHFVPLNLPLEDIYRTPTFTYESPLLSNQYGGSNTSVNSDTSSTPTPTVVSSNMNPFLSNNNAGGNNSQGSSSSQLAQSNNGGGNLTINMSQPSPLVLVNQSAPSHRASSPTPTQPHGHHPHHHGGDRSSQVFVNNNGSNTQSSGNTLIVGGSNGGGGGNQILLGDHFLANMLVCEVFYACSQRSSDLRALALDILLEVISRIDQEPRYAEKSAKARVCALFFSYVPTLLKYEPLFADLSRDAEDGARRRGVELNNRERQDMLLLFLHIIKGVDERMVSAWWNNIVKKEVDALLRVFGMCIRHFEYPGVAEIRSRVMKASSNEEKRRALNAGLAGTPVVGKKGAAGRKLDSSSTTPATPNACYLSALPLSYLSTLASLDFPHFSISLFLYFSLSLFLSFSLISSFLYFSHFSITRFLSPLISFFSSQCVCMCETQPALNTPVNTPSSSAVFPSLNAVPSLTISETPGGSRPPSNIDESYAPSNRRYTAARVQTTIASEEKISENDIFFMAQLIRNQCHEANMTVLDLLDHYMQDFIDSLSSNGGHSKAMDDVFAILLSLLRAQQSKLFLRHLFFVLKTVIHRMPLVVFAGPTDNCAELCYLVLKYCSLSEPDTRQTGSSFMYLLMRKNFEDKSTNGFNRVKVQATIALSQIVDGEFFTTDSFLRKSLATIIKYANSDAALLKTSFPYDVEELAMNLYTIIKDTSMLKLYQKDPHSLIDLQYRIAEGYRHSPDLRLTWLQNIAQKHISLGNHFEAAMCTLHAAALVAEFLHMVDVNAALPAGCAAFEFITPNILEESATMDFSSPDQEGICHHKMFQSQGLVALMSTAVYSYKAALMFEFANKIYKLLAPVYEANRDFKKLAEVHSNMAECYKSIIQVTESNKRYFGSFFRVAFYGDVFDVELRDKEYIYKEPTFTRLPEVTARLQEFYGSQYGRDKVELLTDSRKVDSKTLPKGKAFIQVTYVEPFLPEYDVEKRKTMFERNVNINNFKYETPFTTSGASRGPLSDQHMKITYLTVKQCFPYIRLRLPITEVREEILTPIEFAILNIANKTRDLKAIASSRPINVVLLQLQLQGSVSVTVNEGPMEFANTFLKPPVADAYNPKLVKKLKQCFGQFLGACKEALDLNETVIQQDQLEYHKSLRRGYDTIVESLTPLIAVSSRTTKTKSVATSTTSSRTQSLFQDGDESADA